MPFSCRPFKYRAAGGYHTGDSEGEREREGEGEGEREREREGQTDRQTDREKQLLIIRLRHLQ